MVDWPDWLLNTEHKVHVAFIYLFDCKRAGGNVYHTQGSIQENILVYPVTAVNLNKAGQASRNSLELTKNSLVQFSFL